MDRNERWRKEEILMIKWMKEWFQWRTESPVFLSMPIYLNTFSLVSWAHSVTQEWDHFPLYLGIPLTLKGSGCFFKSLRNSFSHLKKYLRTQSFSAANSYRCLEFSFRTKQPSPASTMVWTELPPRDHKFQKHHPEPPGVLWWLKATFIWDR